MQVTFHKDAPNDEDYLHEEMPQLEKEADEQCHKIDQARTRPTPGQACRTLRGWGGIADNKTFYRCDPLELGTISRRKLKLSAANWFQLS